MVGVGGVKEITFDCIASGADTLTLVYGRPWLLDGALAPLKQNPKALFNPKEVEAADYAQIRIVVS